MALNFSVKIFINRQLDVNTASLSIPAIISVLTVVPVCDSLHRFSSIDFLFRLKILVITL